MISKVGFGVTIFAISSLLSQNAMANIPLQPGLYYGGGSRYVSVSQRGNRLCYGGASKHGYTSASIYFDPNIERYLIHGLGKVSLIQKDRDTLLYGNGEYTLERTFTTEETNNLKSECLDSSQPYYCYDNSQGFTSNGVEVCEDPKELALKANNTVANITKCDRAVASVENQLVSGRSLQIENSVNVSGDTFFGTPPAERPEIHHFGISGNAVGDVMNSPVFLNNLATEIIDNCHTVSAVSFNLSGSDYIEGFGLKDGQNVERFTCPFGADYDPYDPSTQPRPIEWGENCS